MTEKFMQQSITVSTFGTLLFVNLYSNMWSSIYHHHHHIYLLKIVHVI